MPQSERKDAGENARADRACAALALAIALVLSAATLAFTHFAVTPAVERLDLNAAAGAQTVADVIAEDFARAVGLGIPLDAMRGVEGYVSAVLSDDTLVGAVGILDTGERLLFRVGEGGDLSIRSPILVEGALVGTVAVAPRTVALTRARNAVFAAGLALSIALGALCAVLARAALLRRVNLPLARLAKSGDAVARGIIASFGEPPRASPVRAMGEAAATALSPVRRQHRRLTALADEVRALDTDGRFRPAIDGALESLSDLTFDRPYKRHLTRAVSVLIPFALLTAFTATAPLVASFAADRVAGARAEAVAAGLTLALYGLSAAGGAHCGLLLRGRLRRPAMTILLTLAAAATALTYALRDPFVFAGAQAFTGFAAGCLIAGALSKEGAALAAPFRAALVVGGALAIGPALGALLAEAQGRRIAFATIGALIAVLAFALSLIPQGTPRRASLSRAAPRPAALGVLAFGLGLASLLALDGGRNSYREDYAGLALFAAASGGTLLIAALLRPKWPAAAATGSAVLVLAPVAFAFGAPFGAAALLGVGGAITLSARAGCGAPFILLPCGVALAGLLEAGSGALGLPPLLVQAAAILALCAAIITLGLRAKRAAR
ncbi:MAG: hypothetical protein AAF318_16105 [Pseudomonadota bacterium]